MRCPLDLEVVDILREYQAREGITVTELARRLGMTQSSLSRLFSDKYVSSLKLDSVYEIMSRIGYQPTLRVTSKGREKISA